MNILSCLLLTCLWCVVTSLSRHCLISGMSVEVNGTQCDVMNRGIRHQTTYEAKKCGVSLTCIDGGINACVSETLLCTIITLDCNILMREITPRVDRLICKK
ncbi:uncharacterized protein [Haliotis asinina]|uniref:uncharacterized protein n=1 Tax=Haliotis asinina TaxID=109174 RepID=UPI0035325F70